tara:strand:- start:125 stop:1963 length:1839 start_codon:yes stop_codon:yes gene_type:complete
MAWKKILFSGSQGELSSLAVDGNITGVFQGALSSSAQIGADISGSLSAAAIAGLGAEIVSGSSFSGSFQGNGANLTGITVSQAATVTSNFTNQTSVSVDHNFDSRNVSVTVYNSSNELILPASVTLTTVNRAVITFDLSTSGFIVIAKGGHIVSGSVDVDNIDGFDEAVVAALPSNSVSASALSTPSQGSVTLTTNGVANALDLGLQTGDSPTFVGLTLTGDLEVRGTTTTINSTTVDIGDNIVALNGSGAALGGLHINDANGPKSGSLLWDGTNNKWIAGASGSEVTLALLEGQGLVSGSAAQVRTFINVEDGADVTDATNVTAAGALMDSEVASLALIKSLTAADISGSFVSASNALGSRIDNVSSTITLSADSGTNDTYTTGETLTFEGDNSITTTVSDNKIAISIANGVVSSSAQLAADISGSFVSASNALGSRIDGISTDFDDITNKPALVSGSAEGDAQGQVKINGVNVNVNALGTNDSPAFTNLTVNGDLTVTGNTFEAQVSNLNVEDKFIVVNSGSSSGESGIVFGGSDPAGSGAVSSGSAIFWDSTNVFGFAQDVASSATAATLTSKLGNIETSNSNPSSAPTFQGTGTTHVNESDESIWIFS